MKKNWYNVIPINFWVLFGCSLVVIINLCVQSEFIIPIFVDEIGYISYPAIFAGYKWKGMLSYVPYYGFGYGVILLPFFLICKTIEQVYLAIKILNILLLIIIFLTLAKLGSEIWKINNLKTLIYSLVCCVIPSVLVTKNYALSEIIIIVIYLFILLILKKYVTSGEMKWKILYLVLNIYLLTVHLRTIGVVFISCAVIIFWDIKYHQQYYINKKSKRMFVIMGIVILFSMLVGRYGIQSSELGQYNNANSISAQLDRILALFNLEYMKSFLLLVLSRIWTYSVSYMGISAIGMSELIFLIVKDKKNRLIYIFILLSFVSEFLINCVFMSTVGRLDVIFYTRYSEFCIIPILYLGIRKIFEKGISLKNIFLISLITLCTYQSVRFLLDANKQISEFLTICVPNVSIWWKNGEFSAELATKLTIIFLFSIYFFSKRKYVWLKIIPLFFIVIIWVNTANNSIRNYEKTLGVQKYDFNKEIEFISANGYQKVYAVVGTKEYYVGRYYECWLQLALPYMEIQCIPIEDCFSYIDDKNTTIIIPQRLIGLDEKICDKYFQCETEYFYFLGK